MLYKRVKKDKIDCPLCEGLARRCIFFFYFLKKERSEDVVFRLIGIISPNIFSCKETYRTCLTSNMNLFSRVVDPD
jgi:hypothetical protein